MKKVILDKMDTCLTYALKRIGRFGLYPIDYDRLIDGKRFKVIAYKRKKLQQGDILLWDWDDAVKNIPMSSEITKGGKLIFHKVYQGFHCAVYEGNGLFSDCDQEKFYPYIRVRPIQEVKPCKILRSVK